MKFACDFQRTALDLGGPGLDDGGLDASAAVCGCTT
jgi:hypothetical protein